MADKKQEFKFPTEVIDLPSKGRVYTKDSPLSSGKIEIKYMTAKEEDILTSQNLIKKGIVIDKLLDSLIVDNNIKCDDLVLGDKNAVMVAARILAYGDKYNVEVIDPNTGEKFEHTFNLSECPFKEIDKNISGNEFEIKLSTSKALVKFKLLTGKEEKLIESELNAAKKLKKQVSTEVTTRLKHLIISVNGEESKDEINVFVDNMLSRDSLELRNKISEVSPDIEMYQEIEIGGEMVKVNIPLTIEFFWPSTSP